MFVRLLFRQARLWVNNLKYGVRLVQIAFRFPNQNTCVHLPLVCQARSSLLPKTSLLGLIAICATQDDIFSAIAAKKYRYIEKVIKKDPDLCGTRHSLGWTPLMAAVVMRDYEMTKLLLNSGVNPNDVDHFPGSLKLARERNMYYGDVEWRRLTQFSDFLNPAADFRGCTALHYAVLVNDLKLVELLIEKGADVSAVNERGHRPIMYAKDNAIKELLRKAEVEHEKRKAEKEREERRLQPLESRLRKALVGQEAAIRTVSAAIRRKENGWYDEDHPLVFLFLGSSGIGKTELAKQVAAYLHKDVKKGFIRIDMSEYQQKHEVSKFIGSPPGYIGHEQGGQLTEALAACPNAVVLFDETEKAHPDVLTALLQLFDEVSVVTCEFVRLNVSVRLNVVILRTDYFSHPKGPIDGWSWTHNRLQGRNFYYDF
ncbi:ATP-dependent Clp protease ATP-binding subunit ClpB [Paragonimus westermani]|uniref:ATP-dependent Clp protease ATP-binding subunit ClpB n=1 Tax=Paragonimus westermani TaxID=34504 RepID=A0A5J4NNP2_9TREM|nr:ATP-dependent Clp protease ATP-binding subunit ClpB [Paragonimus westermani]